LKKLLLPILIIVVSLSYYIKGGGISPQTEQPFENDEKISSNNNPNNFKCDGRKHCSQMNSYEEAKYFIENCPDTKMDGDNDGKPCERQFGHY